MSFDEICNNKKKHKDRIFIIEESVLKSSIDLYNQFLDHNWIFSSSFSTIIDQNTLFEKIL